MANPERVEGREDQWMCPFCKKKDFYELSQVWSHFDATDPRKYEVIIPENKNISDEKCPGEIMGVEIRLENGLIGTIFNKDISASSEVTDPTSRMKRDQVVTGRIIKSFSSDYK